MLDAAGQWINRPSPSPPLTKVLMTLEFNLAPLATATTGFPLFTSDTSFGGITPVSQMSIESRYKYKPFLNKGITSLVFTYANIPPHIPTYAWESTSASQYEDCHMG